MPRTRSSSSNKKNNSTANLGFEQKLWLVADFIGSSLLPSSFCLHPLQRLAIRGIEAHLGEEQADTFRRDLHPDLRADFVLTNRSF